MEKLNKGLAKSIEKIKGEFDEGFRFASQIKDGVCIFGGGRISQDNPYYEETVKLANLLAKDGFSIITGGGPGIMEAANKGANVKENKSIALNIVIPDGQDFNQYVEKGMTFDYFFSRKVMFAVSADYYVFLPGGWGTLDEFFEIANLVNNDKINNPPYIVLIGKEYWEPIINVLKDTLYKNHKTIDEDDFNYFNLAESAENVFELIKNKREKNLQNNYGKD